MTARVDTLDALITGSSSRSLPRLLSLSAAVLDRVAEWWGHRSTLMMSDEWLQEHRWRERDHY